MALFAPAGKTAMQSSIHSNRPPRCVVYTCMFGSSEHFNDFVYAGDGVDFICFTDDPDLRSDAWTIRLITPGLLDPTRSAKRIKALPHRFLPEYDWSLYIDNTVRLKAKPRWIFDKIFARNNRPFVCFRHYARNCVYAEADRVIELGYDDPERVRAQTRFYRHLGYPENYGLAALPFILRRHNDPELIPIMEAWYQQLLLYSFRDQISFNPVSWYYRFNFGYINLKFKDLKLFDWPVVKDGLRVPRDFDDARYLEFNPDVTHNPRRHFLYQGAIEGRRYK